VRPSRSPRLRNRPRRMSCNPYNGLLSEEIMLKRLIIILIALSVGASAQTAVQPSAKQSLLRSKLEDTIHDVDGRLDGVMGVAILDLTNGETILLHADEVFPTASSIKIAVLAELYRQTEQAQ